MNLGPDEVVVPSSPPLIPPPGSPSSRAGAARAARVSASRGSRTSPARAAAASAVADAALPAQLSQASLAAHEEATVVPDVAIVAETVNVEPPAEEVPVADQAPADPETAAPAARTFVNPRAVVAEGAAAESAGIRVRGLTKRYGAVLAVDSIDLDVPGGSITALVGPNGAGKTTALSMMTGLLRPDGGAVEIDGVDAWLTPHLARPLVGVLPDRLGLFDRLTGAQLLASTGALRGLDRVLTVSRSRQLAEALGITDALGRVVADYSLGMTKKIALACALIHSPRVLVLDEPLEALDPVSAQRVIDVLRMFASAGGAVLLSSHNMEIVERISDRIVILVDGRVLADGPAAEVIGGMELESRFVQLAGGTSAVEELEWLREEGGRGPLSWLRAPED